MCFKYFVARPGLQGGRASQFVASPRPSGRQWRSEADLSAWLPRSTSASATVAANC